MSYNEITLVDCNRLNSVEFLGGNKTSKALWNNLVGSGLKVNPGDVVSVHNTFISEVGSTSGIEFNSLFLEKKQITYTKLTPKNYLTYDNSASFINERQLGYQRVTASNITEEIDVRQNECHIQYNYYKTSNGENYFNIPRRFAMPESAPDGWKGLDQESLGKCYQNPALISFLGASFLPNDSEQMFHCDADYYWYQNGSGLAIIPPTAGAPGTTVNASLNFLKMRNDNSRFKIFINKETHYGYQTDEGTEPEAFSLLYYNKWSPAYYEYLEYIESLKISLPTGFSSEEAIAENITDTLRKVSQPQVNNFVSLSEHTIPQISASNLMKDLPMSLELNTNTYKTFWSAGVRISNASIWTTWNACVLDNNASTTPRNDDETGQANNYLSGYQYVGVKRPELFLRCREFCKTYGFNHGNLNNAEILLTKDLVQSNFLNYNDFSENASNEYHIIKTQMLWSDVDKQKSLSEIFKEQGNHPELMTNRYNQYFKFTDVSNSRFLHMNILCNASRGEGNASHGNIPEQIIGWDYMTTGASTGASNSNVENLNSTPLFIDYNPKYENSLTNGNTWDDGYRFGFLRRYIATDDDGLLTGTEYCAFTTAHFGIGNNNSNVMPNYTSIPLPYFGLNTTRYSASIHIEDFDTATGSNGSIMSGFNDNLFLNGVLGSAPPAQLLGGTKTENSGTGLGSTGGFNSLAEPQPTNKYINFTGINPRLLTTRNIGTILTTGEQIQIYYIQGNSTNGASSTVAGEDLEMIIYDIALSAISTTKIALGASSYVGSAFSLFSHEITTAEQAGVYIGIYQPTSGGVNENYGVKYLSVAFGEDNIIDKDTGLGIDVHFNAYGNQVIGLLDGYLEHNFDGSAYNTMNTVLYNASLLTGPFEDKSLSKNYEYVNKIYLGADQPALEFNSESGRFQFSSLHTAERVQNKYNAGGLENEVATGATAGVFVPAFPSAGLEVYKINKRLLDNNFTPTMLPYTDNNTSIRLDATTPTQTIGFIDVFNLNPNLQAWNIFDQLSGIIIKNFGYSEATWGDGIWGILGFDYNSFNSVRNSTNDLTSRVGTDNKENLPYAFTNAAVESKQVLDFPTNAWGEGKYTLQIPITMSFNCKATPTNIDQTDFYFTKDALIESFPAITENASSIKLVAKNLPKKIKNGYYIIRSNILDGTTYSGGESGQTYPIVSVVSKNNFNNDFFVGGESSLRFTFNKETTITSIQTSIHNPDQSLSDVDSNSAVIYKIERKVDDNFDIVSQILNEEKDKNKKK